VITFSLQSGSNGNSIYVEAAGVRLLFDAGISGKLAEQRMAQYGRDIREVDAVLLSHDHIDHVCCAGIYQRKFGLPIYMTRVTRRAIQCDLGRLNDVRYFRAGESVEFDPVTVHTLRTPHDAADGVAFIVECQGRRLGILSDLGHPFAQLAGTLGELDAAYLESNYDPQMLEEGSYPAYVKARIRGAGGHLSNIESADLLRGCPTSSRPISCVAARRADRNGSPWPISAKRTTIPNSPWPRTASTSATAIRSSWPAAMGLLNCWTFRRT
jgi:phosphoribosyl 1,2-cyclic phosphodiesterase